MRAVSNSGPLIHLSWIGHLDLLTKLCEEVVVPPAVRDEVLAAAEGTLGLNRIQGALTSGDLVVRAPDSTGGSAYSLDLGETETLLLAEQINADCVLTDDRSVRRAAVRRGLQVKGTLGILPDARDAGLIPAALPLVHELRRVGQWFSDDLVKAVAEEEAGEQA